MKGENVPTTVFDHMLFIQESVIGKSALWMDIIRAMKECTKRDKFGKWINVFLLQFIAS